MSDEQRADWLARSLHDRPSDGVQGPSHSSEPRRDGEDLHGEAGLWGAGMPDDAELVDLAALAARLQGLGPSMALIASADAAFDPVFAQRLKGIVVAAHSAVPSTEQATGRSGVAPGTQQRGTVVSNAVQAVAPVERATPANAVESSSHASGPPRWAAFGSRLRSLWGLILLVAAAIVVAVAVAVNSATPQPQRASARATATTAVRPFLMQRNVSRTPNTRAMIAPSDPGPTATLGIVPMAGSFGSLSGTVVPGSAPPPVAPGVVAGASPHDTARSRGTVTPGPDFGLYSTGLAHPLAQSPGLVATIPVHYRGTPRLPASAPSFAQSYRSLDDAAVARIVAGFPGLRDATSAPIVLDGLEAARYTAGAEQLEIVAATGEVRYSQRLSPASGTPGTTAARDTATHWLAAHSLLPAGVAARAGLVMTAGGSVDVRFVPALPHPLRDGDGTGAMIGISVRLDGIGRVLAAQRLWPSLRAAPRAALPALPRSIAVPSVPAQRSQGAAGGTPAGPIAAGPRSFEVARVEIVYAAVGRASTARLSPGYLLQGRLAMSNGTGRPYSVVIAGVAP